MAKVSIGENILSVIYSITLYWLIELIMSQELLSTGFAIRQHVNYLER